MPNHRSLEAEQSLLQILDTKSSVTEGTNDLLCHSFFEWVAGSIGQHPRNGTKRVAE